LRIRLYRLDWRAERAALRKTRWENGSPKDSNQYPESTHTEDLIWRLNRSKKAIPQLFPCSNMLTFWPV
jgi:hypothetical protein